MVETLCSGTPQRTLKGHDFSQRRIEVALLRVWSAFPFFCIEKYRDESYLCCVNATSSSCCTLLLPVQVESPKVLNFDNIEYFQLNQSNSLMIGMVDCLSNFCLFAPSNPLDFIYFDLVNLIFVKYNYFMFITTIDFEGIACLKDLPL